MSPGQQAGFTLLEVLVSLLVFALIMTGLAQGTQFGLKAWALQSHATEMHQDLEVVDRTLRHLVGTIAEGTGEHTSATFVGNRRSMAFTAAMPDAVELFGTRQVDVIVSVDQAHHLVLRWAPHFTALLAGPPAPHVTQLLTGVDHVELSYWATGQGGERWIDTWQAVALPTLIRITVVFVPGDTRQWPPILASVDTQ